MLERDKDRTVTVTTKIKVKRGKRKTTELADSLLGSKAKGICYQENKNDKSK